MWGQTGKVSAEKRSPARLQGNARNWKDAGKKKMKPN